MKYKITESTTYKNFIAVPVGEYIDYGAVTFDSFEEAGNQAKDLAKEKYPEIWGEGNNIKEV